MKTENTNMDVSGKTAQYWGELYYKFVEVMAYYIWAMAG